ncbi:Cyb5p PWA37_003437 [Arxiozyma heterogenica]|uniref:Cyb5p n=1 Tax=Arxiozyma heterogenica TaxID=278026 RepID=UPI002EE4BA9E
MAVTLYTYEEVAKHNKVEDAWIVIDGKVYDITNFLDEHPGGEEIIFENAGGDATESFLDIGHSDDAMKILKGKYIGDMDPNSKPLSKKETQPAETVKKSEGSPTFAMVLSIACLIIGYYVLNN